MEKDSTGSQDQEEAPTVVGPEGFVPHMVENFEKHIQDQVTESTQVPTGPVVRITYIDTSVFNKIFESFYQEQKESQSRFFEFMTKTLEESKKAFSQKLDHHLQQTTSVIQQSAKSTSVKTLTKASK